MYNKISFMMVVALVAILSSCKKDTQTEQENITKITVHLTGSGGFDKTFSWSDPDGGDTGNATIDDIVIPAGTTGLQAQISVLNESQTPVEDLTDEIQSESAAHLFVYKPTGTAITSIDYADQDVNGKPFGLKTNWVIGSGSGSVEIVLHHQPATKDDLNNPGGEIDFDVSFPVVIQ